MVYNDFYLDGECSSLHNLYVTGHVYGAPERDLDYISVPGRNGDLVIDNGRYKNLEVLYECGLIDIHDIDAVKAWLYNGAGYRELTDTYDPDHFRYASFAGPVNPETWRNRVGQFEVIFNCKPFRYRKDGLTPITLTASGSVYNAYHRSEPKLVIYGTAGTVTIGTQTITLTAIDEYVTIDGGNAFKGTTNKNNTVSMPDQLFLLPGENAITIGEGISSMEIIPRWCEL